MAPAFSKEAILCGSVDHLCLVCESYLRSEREVCLHVTTPAHSRNLDSTDYVDKYRNDRVRKIKKWYFCEFCNALVSTISKVRLHVEDPGHKDNMTKQIIARKGDVIVCGNIVISENAWHGFIDENTCTICNVEFDDKDEHRAESSHTINLIQSKVSNDLNNVYRKIDDSTFHCLTCNMVVVEINAHLDDKKHKNLLQKCNKIKTLIPEEDSKKENETSSPVSVHDNGVNDDKNIITKENAKNHSDVTKISHTKTLMGVKDDVKVVELTTNTDKKTYIISDSNGKTSCTLCNCDVDPLQTKIHLNGRQHQNKLKTDKSLNQKSNTDGVTDNISMSDILDSVPKFQKENININFESRTAVCRRCSVIIDFDSKAIDKHIIEAHSNNNQNKTNGNKETINKAKDRTTLYTSPVFQNHGNKNTDNVTVTTPTEQRKENDNVIKKIAEEHNLVYSGNCLSCELCNKNIPTSERNIKEHANGEVHKNKVKLSNVPTQSKDLHKKINTKKCKLQRVPIQQFVRLMTTIKNMFAEDVVINRKYCINLLAFTFLTMTGPGRLRCQACEVNLHLDDMKDHLDIKRHERALNEVPVIIHTDSEFIREVHSEIFQCGFCNIIDSWEGMESHLKSTDHKESKTFANWRLSQHLPQIERHQMERQIHNEFLMRLMFS